MEENLQSERVPFASVIIPTRNSGRTIAKCLESVFRLNYPKNRLEIIVTDAFSNDQTRKIAEDFKVKLIDNPKVLSAPGRYIAFKESRGDVVAFIDSDCIADQDWLKNSLKYFDDKKIGCVGGPNITPQDDTSFGKAVGFVFDQPMFAAGSTNARIFKQTKPVETIAFCNTICRREMLNELPPFDSLRVTCVEPEMGKWITDLGYTLLYTPDTFVWHYRRSNIKALLYQMYRYGIGRLQLGKKDKKFLNLAHIIGGISLPFIVAVLIASYMISQAFFVSLFGIGALCVLAYFLLGLFRTKSFLVSLYVPVVILTMMIGWSCGFLRELFFPVGDKRV